MTTVNVSHYDKAEDLPTVELHHLPCKVNTNESANVKSYFCPKVVESNGKQSLRSTFRGRLLDGKTVKLPSNYCGYILTEKQKPFSEEENREVAVTGKFDSFTKWYLDSQFLGSNATENVCSTWAGHLAEAVHGLIEPQT